MSRATIDACFNDRFNARDAAIESVVWIAYSSSVRVCVCVFV